MFEVFEHPMAIVERITDRSGKVLRTGFIKVNHLSAPDPHYSAFCMGSYGEKERLYSGSGESREAAVRDLFSNMKRNPDDAVYPTILGGLYSSCPASSRNT